MTYCSESDHDISNWIALFRKAGYDVKQVGKSPCCELTSLEKFYLSMDMDFLEKMPVEVIMDGDINYPEQFTKFLNSKRPRALFCMGNVSLFNMSSIFVGGARDASKTGLELAYKCGRLIAEAGNTVISGYARGVDMAAHLGSLEGGGTTIAILPYGLSRFAIKQALIEVFDPDRFLVVSELPPSCVFMTKAAFRRNMLLVALAHSVIVVEPGESGGTWHSAEKAQSMHKPLYFLEGERPDIIARLESMGGYHLNIRNGAPILDEVYENNE